ncbi:hypothetical protein EYZ11_010763 [Aspergillus tanneri]|uniref:Uncharacterized protein n=1 Tax=Aspergillus tanneri TaxID=1220188 RepID=A0A4S3J4U4_9EURO|nr:hypothetical protein EYZ11_010763 [Aspergillus tanneri]
MWTWGTWKGCPDSQYLISPNTFPTVDAPRFWIDEQCDEFRSEKGPIMIASIRISHLYSAWVEYFYRNQATYDCPIPVDRKWRNHRKYWATRQSEVLEK